METPKALIVCRSTHHGNTWRVAHAMAEVLGADILPPEDVDPDVLGDFDLVGFGSGIYFGRPHPSLRQLVAALRRPPQCTFLFSTAGLPFLSSLWHRGMKRRLERIGSKVVGEFACRGWDTVGPLVLIGGLNRNHPDECDLDLAREFARAILEDTRSSASAR